MVGYVAAIFMGKVDFTSVMDAAWFSIPTPMAYGMTFHRPAIIAMLILYVVTTVETVGGAGREATDQELSGGVIADGLASSFAALDKGTLDKGTGLLSFNFYARDAKKYKSRSTVIGCK